MGARRFAIGVGLAAMMACKASWAIPPPPPNQPPPLPTTPPPPSQPPPTPPPAAPGVTTIPAPGTQPAAPLAEARPAGTARVYVKTYKDKGTAKLYAARSAEGPYALVCTSPCKADVFPNTPLRVTLDDSEPKDFTMTAAPGSDLDIEVRGPSKGALAGGIVMISIGAIPLLVGVALLAVGATGKNLDDDEEVAAWICLVLGGGLTGGGIALIATRSKEPKVRENEHKASSSSARIDSKVELWNSDMTAMRGPSPMGTPRTFGWTFAF